VTADLWKILRTLLVVAVLAGVLAGIAGRCATERVLSTAGQSVERDTARARGRRDAVRAREEHVARNAEKARGDSLLALFRVADSLASDAVRRLSAALPVDTNDVASLRHGVRARDSVIVAQAAALADARLVAPAYLAALDHGETATILALSSADHFARADTLSQVIGEQRERAAHRRGIVQGIKGTVTVGAVLVVVGFALHLGGKF
jgi:hypothetical protein